MRSQRQGVPNDPKRARVRATRTSANSTYRKIKKIDQRPKKPPPEVTGNLDARFREVMDAAPVMIWVSGKDKGCVWFNKPWRTFTGRRLTQEVGNGWSKGVHHDDFDRCIKVYSSHFDGRKDFRMQYRLRRHDGAYRWIDDTGIPRFTRDGTFLGYIGSCIDVHEHREVQLELRRRLLEIAELNRQADTVMLAASIAHEINQPLTAIASNAAAGLRWLARETPNVDRARTTLGNIVHAEQRAAEIIDSIRAISKNENRIRAPLSLNELIREVVALVEAELQSHHITLRTTLNETIPDVLADRVQLQQVMLNLIKNAIEAMSSVVDSSRVLHLKTELNDSQSIVVTVQDSGTGIDPKNIERIFNRFFTTKTQGMGMGLAICRSIVEAHNGRLWAEAEVHQGSLFRISLPVDALEPLDLKREAPIGFSENNI
jgi:PAS domain S-box-containing protein